jgi:hypothetical protein
MDQDVRDQLVDLKERIQDGSEKTKPEILQEINAGEHEVTVFVDRQEISVAYSFCDDAHLLTMLCPLKPIPEPVVQEIVAIFMDSPQELSMKEHPFGRYFLQSPNPTDAEGFTAYSQKVKEIDSPPPSSFNPN